VMDRRDRSDEDDDSARTDGKRGIDSPSVLIPHQAIDVSSPEQKKNTCSGQEDIYHNLANWIGGIL
jgi:hypothetical protein